MRFIYVVNDENSRFDSTLFIHIWLNFNEVSGGTRMELNIIYTCETAGVEDFKFVPMETSNTVLCKWFSQVYTFTIFPFSCSFFK